MDKKPYTAEDIPSDFEEDEKEELTDYTINFQIWHEINKTYQIY